MNSLSYIGQEVWNTLNAKSFLSSQKSSVPIPELFTFNNKFEQALLKGEQIFPAAEQLIAEAEFSVCLVTFLWTDNADSATSIANGILKAQQKRILLKQTNQFFRPLHIRILLAFSPFINLFEKSGLQSLIRWKDTFEIDPEFIQLELGTYSHLGVNCIHSKYFTFDNYTTLITGDNLYSHSNYNENAWFDSGYVLSGPITLAVQKDFEYLWDQIDVWHYCSKRNNYYCDLFPRFPIQNFLQQNNKQKKETIPMIFLPQTPGEGFPFRNSFTTFASPQNQGFLAAIRATQNYLLIITPTLNAKTFLCALKELILRNPNVKLKLLTNEKYDVSIQNLPWQGGDNLHCLRNWVTKNPIIQESIKDKKIEIRLFSSNSKDTYLPKRACSNHTKLMIIDGLASIVGSGNHDTQTWEHSGEANILIDDSKSTKEIEEKIFYPLWNTSIPCEEFPFSYALPFWFEHILFALIFLGIFFLVCKFVFKFKVKEEYWIALVVFCLLIWIGLTLSPKEIDFVK